MCYEFFTPPRDSDYLSPSYHHIVSGLKMLIIREKNQFAQKRENLCNLWNKEKYFFQENWRVQNDIWNWKIPMTEKTKKLSRVREKRRLIYGRRVRVRKILNLRSIVWAAARRVKTQLKRATERRTLNCRPLNYSECSPKTFAPSNRLSNLNLSPPNVNWTGVQENVENKRREKKSNLYFINVEESESKGKKLRLFHFRVEHQSIFMLAYLSLSLRYKMCDHVWRTISSLYTVWYSYLLVKWRRKKRNAREKQVKKRVVIGKISWMSNFERAHTISREARRAHLIYISENQLTWLEKALASTLSVKKFSTRRN